MTVTYNSMHMHFSQWDDVPCIPNKLNYIREREREQQHKLQIVLNYIFVFGWRKFNRFEYCIHSSPNTRTHTHIRPNRPSDSESVSFFCCYRWVGIFSPLLLEYSNTSAGWGYNEMCVVYNNNDESVSGWSVCSGARFHVHPTKFVGIFSGTSTSSFVS